MEYKFIDLFSGLGGFHQAIKNIKEIKSNLILSSDIDKNCQKVYDLNFGNKTFSDFMKIDFTNINFDVLMGGFPCQPYSVSGNRLGLDDSRGSLLYDLIKLIENKKPKLICLENVKGLKSKKNKDKDGNEVKAYNLIYEELERIGYFITDKLLSPTDINIPQKRERVIFIAILKTETLIQNKDDFKKLFDYKFYNLINEFKEKNSNYKILEDIIDKKYYLNDLQNQCLNMWEDFVNNEKWNLIDNKELQLIFGKKCNKNFKQEHFFTDFLKYRNTDLIENKLYKDRKNKKISKSVYNKCYDLIKLYDNNIKYKELIDSFLEKWKDLIPNLTYYQRYLEYSGGVDFGTNNTLNDKYCQMRMSGIRIRTNKYFPTIVKSGPTPVLIKERRFLTPREVGNLQSFDKNYKFLTDNITYKQLGNAVNVQVIELMLRIGFWLLELKENEIDFFFKKILEIENTKKLNYGIKEEKNFINHVKNTIKNNPNCIIDGKNKKAIDIKHVGGKGKKNDCLIIFDDDDSAIGISFKMSNSWYVENWLNIDKLLEIEENLNNLKKLFNKIIENIDLKRDLFLGLSISITTKITNFPLPENFDTKKLFFNNNTNYVYIQDPDKKFRKQTLQELINSSNLKDRNYFNDKKLYYDIRFITFNSFTNIAQPIIAYFHTDKTNLIINNKNDIIKNFTLTPIFNHCNVKLILQYYICKKNISFKFNFKKDKNNKDRKEQIKNYKSTKFILPDYFK